MFETPIDLYDSDEISKMLKPNHKIPTVSKVMGVKPSVIFTDFSKAMLLL